MKSHTRKIILSLALIAGAAIAGPLTPPAGPISSTYKTLSDVEPRTPIDHLPFSASQSGSYYLTRSLTAAGPGHGITLAGTRITLDLCGFSLDGIPGSGDAIHAPGTSDIVIKNGSIRNWGGRGVDTTGGGLSVIDHVNVMTCSDVGIVAGPLSVVSNCQVIADPAGGIETAFGCRITDCSVTDCGASSSSIAINATNAGSNLGGFGLIRNCTASRNLGYGIRLDTESLATGCSTHLNGAAGIWAIGQSAVDRCVSTGNNFDGITAGDHVTVRASTSSDNGDDGIQAGAQCAILHNSCHHNGPAASGAGVYLTGNGSTRVSDNDLTDNRYGVLANATTGNLIIRNSAFANAGGDFTINASNNLAPVRTSISATWSGFGPGTTWSAKEPQQETRPAPQA